MSRFVINKLVYDTDKMEHIGTVEKLRTNCILGVLLPKSNKLYRSAKGNYLLTWKDEKYIFAEAIQENEAKDLLMRYDYDNYRRIFGDLEEA